MFHVHLGWIYFVAYGYNALHVSYMSIWFNVSFKASFHIDFLSQWSIDESCVLKSSTIVLLFLLFRSVYFIYLGAQMLGAYLYHVWLTPLSFCSAFASYYFVLKSILSHKYSYTSFPSSHLEGISFSILSLLICVSLELKRIL